MKADLSFSHSPALERKKKKKSHSKNHVGWARCCKHLVNYGKNHLIATKSRHHMCSKSPNNIQWKWERLSGESGSEQDHRLLFRAGIYKLTWNRTAKLQTGPVAAWRQITGNDVRAAGASEQALGFKAQTYGSGPAEDQLKSLCRRSEKDQLNLLIPLEFLKTTHILENDAYRVSYFNVFVRFFFPRYVKIKKRETQKSPETLLIAL